MGGGGGVGIYLSLLLLNTNTCVQRSSTTDVPRVPTPSHVHHGIDQNPMDFFFSLSLPGRKGTVKETEGVMDTPPYFDQNTQIPCL